MAWFPKLSALFGNPGTPVHEASGRGRRALAWMPGNPGAVAAQHATGNDIRAKSRDLVRRNPWANSSIEAFVANAVGTGIKPQSLAKDEAFRATVQELFRDWVEEADAAGQTDFYGLQSLACRAMLEGGECLVRLRPRLPRDGLCVPLQLQLLESEHLPMYLSMNLPNGNVILAGIEFDSLGRRVSVANVRHDLLQKRAQSISVSSYLSPSPEGVAGRDDLMLKAIQKKLAAQPKQGA